MKGAIAMLSKILDVLENEKGLELQCAKKCEWMIKKTWNPFKRKHLMNSRKMFLQHVVGIDMAIRKIKKEFES